MKRIKVRARKDISIGKLPDHGYAYDFQKDQVGYLPDTKEGRGYADSGEFDLISVEKGEPYSINRMLQLRIYGDDGPMKEKAPEESIAKVEEEDRPEAPDYDSMDRSQLFSLAREKYGEKLPPAAKKEKLIERLQELEADKNGQGE